ncbi:MAG: glycosyltransferase [Lunatimonas sp.]|nr:glycosyltransferase [Lunatimonas sp.]
MERAYDLWKNGISGSHHVWGKIEIEKKGEIEVIVFPHVKYRWINKIGAVFGVTHLDQQVRILFQLKSFDILYAPYSKANLKFLLLLKVLGWFRKPIVVTIHQPFLLKRSTAISRYISKLVLAQYEAAVFLSEPLMQRTIEFLGLEEEQFKEKFSTAQWGPDISYYDKYCVTRIPFESCEYFISAGHTDRDFETLIEAFRGLPFKLKIFCTPTSIPKTTDIPSNVEVDWAVTFSKDLIPFYQKSIAILIPLKFPDYKEGCQGMTSIQDVLTFGKPSIITRNRCLNISVEGEGLGYEVSMYDVAGWREKLEVLATQKQKWEYFSENADRVFRSKVNSQLFGDHMGQVFKKVYEKYVTNKIL